MQAGMWSATTQFGRAATTQRSSAGTSGLFLEWHATRPFGCCKQGAAQFSVSCRMQTRDGRDSSHPVAPVTAAAKPLRLCTWQEYADHRLRDGRTMTTGEAMLLSQHGFPLESASDVEMRILNAQTAQQLPKG